MVEGRERASALWLCLSSGGLPEFQTNILNVRGPCAATCDPESEADQSGGRHYFPVMEIPVLGGSREASGADQVLVYPIHGTTHAHRVRRPSELK
jgi:hypothetical protein